MGGFITPPKEYFRIVEKVVRNYGGIFISDEVQTGWGRTGGKWFGIEQYGVVPDIITSAKGLANGSPIGLTVAKPEVADAVKGLTISTFGGNPVTATAAKAVIDFIEEQDLLTNCTKTGAYLHGRLAELKDKHEIIGEVRGMGLMAALELVTDRRRKTPAPAETALALEAARENRIILGKGGMYGNVLRISPPMNVGPSRRRPVHPASGQEPGGLHRRRGRERAMSKASAASARRGPSAQSRAVPRPASAARRAVGHSRSQPLPVLL